jgi:phosphotransferase system  glucose/maltose/N-acetylglucosamine-specific IIC component
MAVILSLLTQLFLIAFVWTPVSWLMYKNGSGFKALVKTLSYGMAVVVIAYCCKSLM